MAATATLERPASVQPTLAPTVPRSTSRRRMSVSKANAELQGKPDAALALQAKQCAIRFLEQRSYYILECDWSCRAGYVDAISLITEAVLLSYLMNNSTAFSFSSLEYISTSES